MTRDEVVTNARYAGQVWRYHTWPVHRNQSTGEHTWQVMRIWFQIWGPLPPEVSSYLIWHDAGELVTGDLPFPVKKDNPGLKREADLVERNAVTCMGGTVSYNLNDSCKHRAKLCDLIEMYEFGKTELLMGNLYAHPIVNDVRANIAQCLKLLSVEDRRLVSVYLGEGPL